MRYSAVRIGINPKLGSFHQAQRDIKGILTSEEIDKLFKDGYAITRKNLTYKYEGPVNIFTIFFAEKHPLFNIGVIKTASFDLPVDYLDREDDFLFKFLLDFLNKHKQ